MGKKIKFDPQEIGSVIIGAIVSAYLLSTGVSPEHATLIGTGISGVTKGLSLSERDLSATILSTLERSVGVLADNTSLELPENCKELLQSEILSPKKIIQFMCRQDPYIALKNQIIQICERDPDCDISTFPVDELVSQIIDKFDQEAFNNHELASYATYCMLRSFRSSSVVHLANSQYVASFTEPLFLHKSIKDSRVNLKNLFVMPKCQLLNNNNIYCDTQKGQEHSQNNLENVIADFLQNDTSFLFVEGDAGSGKTTLAAWMNYHYSLGDEIAVQLFGDRPLVTIRLRDLDKDEIGKNRGLPSAIRKYMNLNSLDELERFFPNAIMLLDGFDELCMIEGMGFEHEILLYDLYKKGLEGFQFIVTTRPKFISPRINLSSWFISLQHFDSEQRAIWLDQYTSEEYCAQPIDETICEYIKSIDDDTSSCICDTPMTLYMLAAKKGTSEILNNNWALYHHIFHEELSETEYNKMFPNPDRNYAHDIHVLRDVLYQVSEEIAYRMYIKGNQSFYLSDKELSDIITTLSNQIPILRQAKMQEVAGHCYALCCYWKANTDRGVVEFLHNNIRDYFLAEKIYREMDELTHIAKRQSWTIGTYTERVAQKLTSLFQFGILETKVCEFLFLRAVSNAEKGKFDFAQYGYQQELIAPLVAYMSRNEIYCSILEVSVK